MSRLGKDDGILCPHEKKRDRTRTERSKPRVRLRACVGREAAGKKGGRDEETV